MRRSTCYQMSKSSTQKNSLLNDVTIGEYAKLQGTERCAGLCLRSKTRIGMAFFNQVTIQGYRGLLLHIFKGTVNEIAIEHIL